jgi:hypothetical protein
MGLSEDVRSRDGIIASMQDVVLKQYLFLRNLALPVIERFGQGGRDALVEAFRQYGTWRGDNISVALSRVGKERDAVALLSHWDGVEFVLPALSGKVVIEGDSGEALVSLPAAPGSDYFARQGDATLLRQFWPEVLKGMARGYDAKLALTGGDATAGAWTLRASYSGPRSGRNEPAEGGALDEILSDPERALKLVLQTSRNNGALYMFIAREVIRRYDAAGELLIREGVRGIGRERGNAIKERHLREGKSLNLKNMMLDWDGPLVSTWVMREGHLSEGTWHQDCRYCPYADVWAEFGQEGLALGYLYDVELHTALCQTYHPNVVVRWEALKTRGDHLCKFRFSIPELVSPDDPQFVPRTPS